MAIACSDDGQIVYVVDNNTNPSGGYIYRTENAAANWIQLPSPQQKWQSIACSDNGKHIIAASNSIWTSDNYGATWTQNTLPGSSGQWRGVAISADGKRKVAVDYGALPPPPATGGRIWVYNKFNESFYQ